MGSWGLRSLDSNLLVHLCLPTLAWVWATGPQTLWNFSAEPIGTCCLSVLMVAGQALWPAAWRQPVWAGEHGTKHKKKQGEEQPDGAHGPLHPAVLLLDASQLTQFCELINLLWPNIAWVRFLSPEKSRLIKRLIELKAEYLTSSWLAQQAILFLRKWRK